jgi:predicted nucleic acid-binding protein
MRVNRVPRATAKQQPITDVVMDAGPLIDYLTGAATGEGVRDQLADTTIRAHAHALNLIEVFYHVARVSDTQTAREALATLEADGVQRREDMDIEFSEDAAALKAIWKRVSLADCCGLALARRLGAEFFTTDRHELEVLEKGGACAIVFAR